MTDQMQRIAEWVRRGDATAVQETVKGTLALGIPAEAILSHGLFAGMAVVGELFKDEEIYIPEVIMAAKAMQAGVDVLEPFLAGEAQSGESGTVVLGTVKGDLHDLGKNLVAIMLRGAGFKVIDLGINVSAEAFVKAAIEDRAQIVAMSGLLTTTIPYMKTVIEALRKAGLDGKVKTLIGGACVTQGFADTIGADGYGENAAMAVKKAQDLIKQSEGS
jgi:5-methyltetrahydrofolate--homocysteine methyltransferase